MPRILVASLLASAFSATALAQEAWEHQLKEQTQLKSGAQFANMSGHGYSLVDVAKTNVLDAGASEVVTVNVPPGAQYAIMGVCDNDCLDLDLTIMRDGIELATDTTDDDWPVVPLAPTTSANYQIKVTMFSCSTANCGYQLTVWKQ